MKSTKQHEGSTHFSTKFQNNLIIRPKEVVCQTCFTRHALFQLFSEDKTNFIAVTCYYYDHTYSYVVTASVPKDPKVSGRLLPDRQQAGFTMNMCSNVSQATSTSGLSNQITLCLGGHLCFLWSDCPRAILKWEIFGGNSCGALTSTKEIMSSHSSHTAPFLSSLRCVHAADVNKVVVGKL